MSKISAEVVADSISPQGERLTSFLITFPRIILSEINTHRMLSKNTSSSRAIPFSKMVETVVNNPFIPLAWQKNHPGMQGTEYLSHTEKYNLVGFMSVMIDTLQNYGTGTEEFEKYSKKVEEKVQIINTLLQEHLHLSKTLDEWWLFARNKAVEAASIMYVFDVTKQLANRLLEPFSWTTMLITGSKSGWDNFFRLRCPSYDLGNGVIHKSRKDALKYILDNNLDKFEGLFITELDWLLANKGQAEIHIMELAEKIWDAKNESTPVQLEAGQWHIPFLDKIGRFANIDLSSKVSNIEIEENIALNMIKMSVAMGARTSYTTVGEEKEVNPETLIGLHDKLLTWDPPHSSPFEHCARAMNEDEHASFIKGKLVILNEFTEEDNIEIEEPLFESKGWCYNLKGFIPYRYLVDNSLTL